MADATAAVVWPLPVGMLNDSVVVVEPTTFITILLLDVLRLYGSGFRPIRYDLGQSNTHRACPTAAHQAVLPVIWTIRPAVVPRICGTTVIPSSRVAVVNE